MSPLDYCTLKARESRSSFLAAFRFLPAAQRNALTVLYAYCRELDDIADNGGDPAVARQALHWRRQDFLRIGKGETPEHPIHQALADIMPRFRLPENELADIINGVEMDLHHHRYADFSQLDYYCYRVAGVVGRLIARILGFQNPQTLEYAQTLGLALQLTNIIRDVGEDARHGRIYLPTDELQRFNVPAAAIMNAETTPEFAALMAFQIQRAEDTYRRALSLLPPEDAKHQRGGLMMAAVYYALLQEIKRDGAENVLKYKLRIPNPRKLRIALKTRLFGFKP